MKKLSILILLIIFSISLNAQEQAKESQISISYGVITMQGIEDAVVSVFGDIFTDILTVGTIVATESTITGVGLFEFRYNYFISEKISMGLRANIVKYKHEDKFKVSDGSSFTTTWTNQFITGMVDANFYYMRKEKIALYSGIGVGVTLNNSEIDDIDDPDYEDGQKESTTLFAFQVNAFGIRFGKTFGGFLETGFGYSGLMNGGLFLKF